MGDPAMPASWNRVRWIYGITQALPTIPILVPILATPHAGRDSGRAPRGHCHDASKAMNSPAIEP
jgi:hypothetical protein